MNFKEWLQKGETPTDLAPGEYMDSMGVRVRDVSVAKGIDAGIAELIDKINTAGFKTIQSMSGLKRDYPYGDRYSSDGYIGFFKDELKPGQEEKIKQAAKSSNLVYKDTKIFFNPAVVIRTGITMAGHGSGDLLKQAGKIALASMKLPPEEIDPERPCNIFGGTKGPSPSTKHGTDNFFKWLDIRHGIHNELIAKHGGFIEDAEIEKRWKLFGDLLVQSGK